MVDFSFNNTIIVDSNWFIKSSLYLSLNCDKCFSSKWCYTSAFRPELIRPELHSSLQRHPRRLHRILFLSRGETSNSPTNHHSSNWKTETVSWQLKRWCDERPCYAVDWSSPLSILAWDRILYHESRDSRPRRAPARFTCRSVKLRFFLLLTITLGSFNHQ